MCPAEANEKPGAHTGSILELRQVGKPWVKQRPAFLGGAASVAGWAQPSAAAGATALALLGAAPVAATCAVRRPLCTWVGLDGALLEDSVALVFVLLVMFPILVICLSISVSWCSFLLQRRRLLGPFLWSRLDKAFERLWPEDRLVKKHLQQRLDWDLWDFHEAPAQGFLLPADVALHRGPPEFCEWESGLLEELRERTLEGWQLLDVVPEQGPLR